MALSVIQRLFSTGSNLNSGNNNSNGLTSDWVNGIPESILESIFDQLSGEDLKNCREVCKAWSILTVPQFTNRTCVAYDCRKEKTNFKYFSSTRTSRRLVKFLSVSAIGFTAWNEMRVKSLNSEGMRIFLNKIPEELHYRSLQNITSLEISECIIKWGRMAKFLRLFENLKEYKDIMNINYIGNVSHCICGNEQSAFEYLEERFGTKPFSITSLKIVRKETTCSLNLLLKLMLRTCRELETFQLDLSNNDFGWIPTIDRTEFSTLLAFVILRQLRTLHNLSFSWFCARSSFYFDDFMLTLGIIFAGDLQLTSLTLHFEWIILSHDDMETLLIPFIQRFTNLKKLALAKIILHAHSAHRLEMLRPVNCPNCDCDFSIVFTDHIGLENHEQILAILEGSRVMINCVYSIRIAIAEIYTTELGQLISVDNNFSIYTHTKELMVNIGWFPLGTEFRRFNISLIVLSFPNLTTLWILDGPRFLYRGSGNIRRQCQRMSPATLGDSDMQTIIDGLPNLKNLRLRVRMVNLTDCGLTGLSLFARERIISNKDAGFCDQSDFSGSCLSKLRNLEEIMLKGLGKGISDISLYLAFSDLPKLKIIHIYGATSITKAGKKFLYATYPASAGCTIHTNI